MTPFQALCYGILQGLTEFLPISSSAHLILLPYFTGWPDPGLSFDVALHAGTLIAVVVYFWKEVLWLVRGAVGAIGGNRAPENLLPWQVVAATIPGAVAGFLLEHKAEEAFRSPWIIAGTMTMMGLFLWVADRGGQKSDSVEHVGTTRAILIGCSQAFAIIPGVSRSGVTITTGLLLGLQRTAAVQFSFFMSMPIIFGAVVLKSHYLFSSLGQPGVALAVIASAVSGLAAIHVLMTYVKTRSFAPFVVYRLALGLGLFAYLLARK